ncbi:MAG: hypothetical protein ACRDST_21255 [Pseudonocardiaceae bacterium]
MLAAGAQAAQRQGVLVAVVTPTSIADPGSNPDVDLDTVPHGFSGP